MSVSYDSKKLIPAPFAEYSKEFINNDDGTRLSHVYRIVLKGTLVAYRGSPDSDGTFWTSSGSPADESIAHDSRLAAILRKQEALQNLFSTDGRPLEVSPLDGSQAWKCNPRVLRVDFSDGVWVDRCDYTVTLEADRVSGLSDDDPPAKVSRATDEWNVEALDESKGTYRLTHALSATGRAYYLEDGSLEKAPWEQARDYVLSTLELGLKPDRMNASGVLDLDLQAFDYLRSQSVNEAAGTFAASETWVCYNPGGGPAAVHDYSVTTRYGAADGRTAVSVEGTITGLQKRNTSTWALETSRWAAASGKWDLVRPDLYLVAQNLSGKSLHPSPLGTSVQANEINGTLSYQYEFDDRPTPTTVGALSESVTVSNQNGGELFATIPVLGRAAGPILQALGTRTPRRRQVGIEIQMPAATQAGTSTAPNTDALVLTYVPEGSQVFLENDEEQWSNSRGSYSRTTSYVWIP